MSVSTVREALASKKDSSIIRTVHPDQSVYEAIRLMAVHNIGALLVMEDKHIAGIITERDYARKVILENKSSRETKVREIMTEKVYYVSTSDLVDDCMALMTERRVRHLPVVSRGRLVGMISQGDIVKAMLSDKAFLIDQLTGYITGTRTDVSTYQMPKANWQELKRAYY